MKKAVVSGKAMSSKHKVATTRAPAGTAANPPPAISAVQELDAIVVTGAAEHNLKNLDISLPKKKLVIFTGVSGSGKSSLAFDTIFAEGQRRYVESLSSYARQFLGQMEKPRFETIRGLSPTIAIEQKAASKNPRSTVGTITEIYDYLRVLYARVGRQHCHHCGQEVGSGDLDSLVQRILALGPGRKIQVLAPLVENRKGEHRDIFAKLTQAGFSRVRIDGVISDLESVGTLAKNKKHTIEVVVDRLVTADHAEFKRRLTDSVETALKWGEKTLKVHEAGEQDLVLSELRSCCGFAFPELDPSLFSFNAPLGMCHACNGLGSVMEMDEAKVIPDASLSIQDGAILPWRHSFQNQDAKDKKDSSWGMQRFQALAKHFQIPSNISWKKIPKKKRDVILHGTGNEEITVKWRGRRSQGTFRFAYEGLLPGMMRRYQQTQSEEMKQWYGKFLSTHRCDSCKGLRLKPEVLGVRVGKASIMDLTMMTVRDAAAFFRELKLTGQQAMIAKELVKEIAARLGFLENVGLEYLTLDRKGPTLSGGEAQRIRLASQIGSELTGVLYILDEPSIGLHQRDNARLLATLKHLRDLGNSVIVVEHDQETIEAADWVADFGPGAGHLGGEIVAYGSPAELAANPASLTGAYLAGRQRIDIPSERRLPRAEAQLVVEGARENNLQNVDVAIPLGLFTCVTGVSGAGKSTLVNQILYPAVAKQLNDAEVEVGAHRAVKGIKLLDKVIDIDQKPIGRTPRSNPATYTKVFDLIRDFFAQLREARERGYDKGRFSFNVKGGRCEACEGDGYIKVEMHFLADVFVPCETCRGRRFNEATLDIKYKEHSIADVLALSVAEAYELFAAHPKIIKVLHTLIDVGLGYVKLGQPATTLSGGEAQRVKLARELARMDTGRTLYILDEPTTGLHFDDIKKLLGVLQRLVNAGNSVVVIEHNLDVIKCADWIIDLGPEGGANGGHIVAQGRPEDIIKAAASHTGHYLARHLKSQTLHQQAASHA